MSLDANKRPPSRSGSGQDLWPKWMWVAVPVLVVVVVAGLWWAILSPTDKPKPTPTPTPTLKIIQNQPTQAPTLINTLPAPEVTATKMQLVLPTFTPTAAAVVTPTAQPTATSAVSALQVGAKVRVTGTGGTGLNMRAGAGTGHARIKTLPEGTVVEIIGGPTEANGYTWWQVRDESGTTGWVVSRYLTP